jgi:nitrile hydratase alpha subunit
VKNGNIEEPLFKLTESPRKKGTTMNLTQEEYGKKMSQLIAKCWADEGFKHKLLANPAATLKALGAELPAGLSIKALENTDKLFHLVIPAKPTDLSDEELDAVAAGQKYELEIGEITIEHPWVCRICASGF